MNAPNAFDEDCQFEIAQAAMDEQLAALSLQWMHASAKYKYTYHFKSFGRPVIQFPQDIVAIQELIWQIRPDLIIETGIAHGGSLILSASMMALLDYCDAVESRRTLDPNSTKRRVLGIDIEIRNHNRIAIESHPMAHRIDMIEGSSIDAQIVKRVHEYAAKYERILVCLDSDHTSDHVFSELIAYAPLVSENSYCVVFDTVVEWSPDDLNMDRPWARGNSPLTAVERYLSELTNQDIRAADGKRLKLVSDVTLDGKLLISTASRGYLRRVNASAI